MPLPGIFLSILKATPAIATAAASLVKAVKSDNAKRRPNVEDNAHKAIQDLRNQLKQMREHSEQQAEVISEVAHNFESLSSAVHETIEDFDERVNQLKAQSEKQTETVSQMAAQIETLSESVQIVSRRVSLMNLAIFGNATVAVVALVLVILWS